jgi:hypothetical protein
MIFRWDSFKSKLGQGWVQGLALILIPIVGAFWTIIQSRIATDAQLRIEMNQPEIRKNHKSNSYDVNVNVEIINSGRTVEFVFIDNDNDYVNWKEDINKDVNNCIDKNIESSGYSSKTENVVSCFLARKIEYEEGETSKEINPFSSTMTGPAALIRKGVAYDYSALFKLDEPGWYSLEYYLVVDYNKDTLPVIYKKHPNRYVTWTSNKYIFVGDETEK